MLSLSTKQIIYAIVNIIIKTKIIFLLFLKLNHLNLYATLRALIISLLQIKLYYYLIENYYLLFINLNHFY